MNEVLLCFVGCVVFAGGLLAASVALLARLLNQLLVELLGSPLRARFFTAIFCASLVTITLAGSLVPPGWLTRNADSPHELLLNSSTQVLSAAAALLLGLGCTGALLIRLIFTYEANRAQDKTPFPKRYLP